jgi:transposase
MCNLFVGHLAILAAISVRSSTGVAERFRAGVPWRDLPERFGDWKIVYQHFNRWAKSGVFERFSTSWPAIMCSS